MSIDYTIRTGFVPLRNGDVTVADTTLAPATAGHTFDEHDRPTDAYVLGPEANAGEIIFESGGDCTAGAAFEVNLWGYAENGPALFICDLSLTAGTAQINDDAERLYIDTATIVSQAHTKTVAVADTGNNRVSKVSLDLVGLKHLYVEVVDVTAQVTINPQIRVF